VKTSVFSTSLTALGLRDAISTAASAGFDAIEVGCFSPHLTLDVAEERTGEVHGWLEAADLAVSALSLSTGYTDERDAAWQRSVDETLRYLRLCGRFGATVLKTMPGTPSSREATERQWGRFRRAMEVIVPVARKEGALIVIENHLGHLSDSIETSERCLEAGDADALAINLDFCNVRTCGEDPLAAIDRFEGRIGFTHVKDSLFTLDSGEYVPMGRGKMAYPPIVERLREIGYDGYLSLECLYPWAKAEDPAAAVAHDLDVLHGLLGTGQTDRRDLA
jgi:sugar phosphate isomerase/epimerase